MEEIRSFIAINLPDEVKAGLKELQSKLQSGQERYVKWVEPDNIHLTLKFLGNVSQEKLAEVAWRMQEVGTPTRPLSLIIRGLGAFPSFRRVQIIWVGIEGELDRLVSLQQQLENRLASLGFTPERRPFVPHLTLARLREGASAAERQTLGQLLAETQFKAVYPIAVNNIALMRSQLARSGAVYCKIASILLKGTC